MFLGLDRFRVVMSVLCDHIPWQEINNIAPKMASRSSLALPGASSSSPGRYELEPICGCSVFYYDIVIAEAADEKDI